MDFIKQQWLSMFVVLVGGTLLWLGVNQDRTPVNTAVLAATAPQVARDNKVDTPVKTNSLQAYSNNAKQKLPIPDEAKAKTSLKAVAAVRVKADDRPNTIVTLVDADTGATTTYVNREPTPFLALDNTGEAAMYYGWRNGVGALRVDIRQALFSVKSVRIEGVASLDQPSGSNANTFIGLGGRVRW